MAPGIDPRLLLRSFEISIFISAINLPARFMNPTNISSARPSFLIDSAGTLSIAHEPFVQPAESSLGHGRLLE